MGETRKILITGGAGWVGLDLTTYLLGKGYEVRVLDVNVQPLKQIDDSNLTLFRGGVEDRKSVRESMRDVDAVFNILEARNIDYI